VLNANLKEGAAQVGDKVYDGQKLKQWPEKEAVSLSKPLGTMRSTYRKLTVKHA
jgi:hypothetical protein